MKKLVIGILVLATTIGLVGVRSPVQAQSAEVSACLVRVLGAERAAANDRGEQLTVDEKTQALTCYELDASGPNYSEDLRSCLRIAVGEAGLAALEGNGSVSAEIKELSLPCLERYSSAESKINDLVSDKYREADPALAACFITIVGADRYEELTTGAYPTDQEMRASQTCFSQAGHTPPAIEGLSVITDEVKTCLTEAYGADRFVLIVAGTATLTRAEREAANVCFGGASGPIAQETTMTLATSVKECIVAALGETRANLILAGSTVPNETERAEAATCLSTAAESGLLTTAVLAPPAEIVPLLPLSTAIQINEQIVAGRSWFERLIPRAYALDAKLVTLHGIAPADSLVDVYLYSEPIQGLAEADETGAWSYTFATDLSAGEHYAYAVSRIDGQDVRSAEMLVSVAEDEALTITTTEIDGADPELISPQTVGIIALLLGLLAYLLYLLRRIHQRHSENANQPPVK